MKLNDAILELVQCAIDQWHLLAPRDPVLIGISGGKDSLTLLRALSSLGYPLTGLYLRPPDTEPEPWEAECATWCDFHVQEAAYYQELATVHNPCFTCSRRRREALIRFAAKQGIRHIALGHHRDDVVITLILNQLFSREISTMMPYQPLFKGEFAIIRPLYLVSELAIIRCSRTFPKTNRVCPYSETSHRNKVQELLRNLQKDHPKIDILDNLHASMRRLNLRFMPYPPLDSTKESS